MSLDARSTLVEQGGKSDKVNGLFLQTDLSRATKRGHLTTVQFLVEHLGADIEKANIHGWTPLHYVAWRGHLEVARYLLGKGAQTNKASNVGGWNPLHYAVYHGHLDVAKLLITHGAHLNARTNAGYLPIDIALTEEIRQAIRDEPRRRRDRGRGGLKTGKHLPSNTAAVV